MRARGPRVASSRPRARSNPQAAASGPARGEGVHRASILSRTARGFTLRALRKHDPALGHRFRGRHLDENAGAARDDRGVLGRHLERGGRARGRGRRATRAGDATGDERVQGGGGARVRRGDHVDATMRCGGECGRGKTWDDDDGGVVTSHDSTRRRDSGLSDGTRPMTRRTDVLIRRRARVSRLARTDEERTTHSRTSRERANRTERRA